MGAELRPSVDQRAFKLKNFKVQKTEFYKTSPKNSFLLWLVFLRIDE